MTANISTTTRQDKTRQNIWKEIVPDMINDIKACSYVYSCCEFVNDVKLTNELLNARLVLKRIR